MSQLVQRNWLIMHAKFYLLFFIFVISVPLVSHSQSGSATRDPIDPEARANARIEQHQREMMSRMRVKREKSLHEEHLARARETAELGNFLKSQFEARQSLDREAMKKLERMEKIVKKLRNQSGGDDEMGENSNAFSRVSNLPTAFTQLAEQSDKLQTAVENTPRLVISTSVIERTNDLLNLIRFIRAHLK